MQALFRFLSDFEVLIYIVLGAGLLISCRWLWIAVKELQLAVYGLERQVAMRHLSAAISSLGVILMLFLGELFIASFIVPDLPASTFLSTPTINPLSASEETLVSGASAAIAGETSVETTVTPAAEGCTSGKMMITSPSPGQNVSGVVEIYGAINVMNLGFYKLEFASAGLENWATFFAGRESDPDEPIGVWDTTQLSPGDYRIRLIATDNQGAELPACLIPVNIAGGP